MTIRPLVRALTVPILGLAMATIAAHPVLAEGAAAPNAGQSVNINQATTVELARLPRVGEKLADRIVAHRSQQGAFKRIEDLMEVKGVGEKMFALLKPYVAVSGPTTLTTKVSTASSRTGARSKAKDGAKAPKQPKTT